MAVSFRSIMGKEPSTATAADSVFIIVDAQNFYTEGPLQISDLPRSRPNILATLNKYRAAKGDIIHIVHHEVKADGDVHELVKKGDGPEDVFEELDPRPDENIVIKDRISGFEGTNLDEVLKKLGKKKIVLAGYKAHVCVSTTARAANDLGYDVLVLSDAIGDRDIPGATAEQLLPIVLAELGDAFATIIKSADIS